MQAQSMLLTVVLVARMTGPVVVGVIVVCCLEVGVMRLTEVWSWEVFWV